MLERIARFFQIPQRQSTISTELLAGLSTFLALSYIVVVNPAILSQAGIDHNAVLFATIVTSALATLLMGVWANLPFALAPGMEMNAYVAFFVVGTLGFSWQQALGACFWSGILFILLTVSGLRERIIGAIPERMKASLSLSVGVFLGLIALKIAGLVQYEGVRLVGLGDFLAPPAYALYVSLAMVLVLGRLRIRAAVLISIVTTSVLCGYLGIQGEVQKSGEVSVAMLSAARQLDLIVILNPRILNVIFILFLIDFYGSVAKLVGLTARTTIVADGKLPRMKEALLVDGTATVLGSVLGTSSITAYVESAVGITAGGRTGLTAVFCAVLMGACFLAAPLLKYIPVVATTGALLWVGIQLCPSWRDFRSYAWTDILAVGVMQLAVVATFALDRAMLAGFVVYMVDGFIHRKPIDPFLAVSTSMLAIGAILQCI